MSKFRLAGISGIGIIVLPIIFFISVFIIGSLSLVSLVIFSLINTVLGVLFMLGFVEVGKRYKSKMLSIMAWIGIVGVIFTFLIFGGLLLFGAMQPGIDEDDLQKSPLQFAPSQGNVYSQEEVDGTSGKEDPLIGLLVGGIVVILINLLIALVFISYMILFGVALIRIGDKVPLAKASGILNIIAGATIILFGLGYFALMVALILEIVMFFKLGSSLPSQRGDYNSIENSIEESDYDY